MSVLIQRAAAMLAAALLFATTTDASAQVYFKAPTAFAGTGCGAGTYVFTGQGTNTLSILFSAYDAGNPASLSASGLQYSACSFAVPVHVPAGCTLSVLTADWRGYAEGTTELFREYFFAGEKGVSKLTSPASYYTERDADMGYKTYSEAAKDVIVRINSSVRAVSANSYIVAESIDMQNSVVFQLQSECPLPVFLMTPHVIH